MKQTLLKSALVILTCLAISSCRKNEIKSKSTTDMPPATGLYILNDGLADASSLSFYNLSSRQVTPDQYFAVNGKPLGIKGNDLEIYGSKMYIAVTNSNVIDIVNAKTGKLIKQDSLLNSTIEAPWYSYSKEPRNMAFYKGSVYISCHDGTIAIMDTLTLSIKSTIALPGLFYQEGLVVANNKLYVASPSIGISVTNTVLVIDLVTNQLIQKISVIPDPISLAADSYGNVYVESSWTDDYQADNISLGGMTVIDSKTDFVKSSFISYKGNIQATSIPITVNGDLVYYTLDNKIAVYDAKTQTQVSTNFVTDGTSIQWPYSICVNPVTGEVYIADAKDGPYGVTNGVIDAFDKTGKLEYSFATGVDPVKIKLLN